MKPSNHNAGRSHSDIEHGLLPVGRRLFRAALYYEVWSPAEHCLHASELVDVRYFSTLPAARRWLQTRFDIEPAELSEDRSAVVSLVGCTARGVVANGHAPGWCDFHELEDLDERYQDVDEAVIAAATQSHAA